MLNRAVEIIKEVFCQLPCYDKIIPELLKRPIEDLPNHCFLAPGIPIKPMLAHPTKGISEVLDRCAIESVNTHVPVQVSILWKRLHPQRHV
jgi:DNA ligase-1